MDSDFQGQEPQDVLSSGSKAEKQDTSGGEEGGKAGNKDTLIPPVGTDSAGEWLYVSPKIPPTGLLDIIYARKSSDKQREDSIKDQERDARETLADRGFDAAGFILLADMDESGLSDSRPEFDRILALSRQRRIRNLATIHLDRFSRGVNVVPIITDIVYHGGRFLALRENIDTKVESWELNAAIRGAMNKEFIDNLRRRSKEGTIGRLLDDNGSVGDFPYGYTSVPIPGSTTKRRTRPKTRVVIDERAAALIVMIFTLFADHNYSIAALCRWIDAHRHEYPALPTKGPMYAAYVRLLLTNTKYIGRWWYGRTKAIRTSVGKKSFTKVDPSEVIWIDRPELRIVPQDLWDRVDAKFAKLKEIHGLREGHRRRGPREHYRLLYAKKLLPGLTFCFDCKSPMLEYASHDKRLNCKGYRRRICKNCVTLPYYPAETAVIQELDKCLQTHAEWSDLVIATTLKKIRLKHAASGADLEHAKNALRVVESRLFNVADEIQDGKKSHTLRRRLDALEQQEELLVQKIRDLEQLDQIERTLPDGKWFADQLAKLASLLKSEMSTVAHRLRPFIKKIVAEPVRFKYRQRGAYRIHITFDVSAGLMPVVKSQFPAIVADAVAEAMPPEMTVPVDLFDSDLPQDEQIDTAFAMRRSGKQWTEIAKTTGVKVHVLLYYWKRFGKKSAA